MAADSGALSRRALQTEHHGIESIEGRHPETEALELDRLIHERVRLGIVSSLAVNGWLTFTDLRDLLGITDGNLSAHAKRLEEAGYVKSKKSQEGRTSKTEFGLTATGRKELMSYLNHMEAIIQATRQEGDQ
ncbi:MAG: transcriptional regulator [Gemmatimonadetes bacterium]|nr:transcriptional regulator [Gemmatimonadota bacterium]NNF11723.1 transcriptional regulator [Gemmatimonadota bacterium]NNL30693.1 transcriptional regulator [Gemmatimonadota bacterium]